MPSSAASGTQAAVLSTTHTLATIAVAGTYALLVDAAALAAGETLLLELQTRALAGGTTRVAYSAVLQHAQAEPIKVSPPVPSLHELIVTLRQEGGTGRSFPWNLIRLDA